MAVESTCPDVSRWAQLLAGGVSAADQAVLEEHLNRCPRCVEFLDALVEGANAQALPLHRLREPWPPIEPALEQVIEDVSRKR
jgi:predicted anti-sigma-YlaC factor YlaD